MSTKKNQRLPGTVHVLVSVDDAHRLRFDDVRAGLKSAGMNIDEVYPITGTLAGAVAFADIARLRRVEGVSSVEEDREFRAYY